MSGKPVASKNCFAKTSDIVINPLSEYLNNDISPCGKKSCQTCNQFVSDQSFKSNLNGKEYKLMIIFLVVHQILSMEFIVSIVVLYK